MMEGETSELEIDSELVMSFYDQYQADDLACKVYCGVDTGRGSLQDSLSLLQPGVVSPHLLHQSRISPGGGGGSSLSASVIELKPVSGAGGSGLGACPDMVPSLAADIGSVSPGPGPGGNTWNLPDLLVGLDTIAPHRDTSSESSISDSPSGECGHDGQLLTSTIPCISLPNLDLTEHAAPGSQDSADSRQSESPFTTYYSCHDPAFSLASVAAAGPGSRTLSSLSGPGAGGHDSLLEGLGILSPPPVTSVKTELVAPSSSSPPPDYSSPGASSVTGGITVDLSQLVSQHNIPAQFELLSPGQAAKCDPAPGPPPGLLQLSQTNSIPMSSLSLSSIKDITNLASVSIANIDLLTNKQGQPSSQGLSQVSLDLIAQHCTLLPPELVSLGQVATFIGAGDQDAANNNLDTMDTTPAHIKEEEECVSPPMMSEDLSPVAGPVSGSGSGPVYKRCHLCVRIFSTKANLSSHIRHVHMGEAKHSRVKSIPCPHCNKMFSRKGHMTEHVRTVHEGKKRIYKEVNCQYCGKTFRRKWGLNIHISSAHADAIKQ